MPPAVPGYPAGHIFPLTAGPPQPRAAWRANAAAVLSSTSAETRAERTLAQIVRTDLGRIGITVSVIEDQACPDKAYDLRTSDRADLLLVSGWPWLEADERDPEPVLDEALAKQRVRSSAPGPGPWNDVVVPEAARAGAAAAGPGADR